MKTFLITYTIDNGKSFAEMPPITAKDKTKAILHAVFDLPLGVIITECTEINEAEVIPG